MDRKFSFCDFPVACLLAGVATYEKTLLVCLSISQSNTMYKFCRDDDKKGLREERQKCLSGNYGKSNLNGMDTNRNMEEVDICVLFHYIKCFFLCVVFVMN